MDSPSLEPDDEFHPTTAAELATFVTENAREARRPLSAVGGRTALWYGAAAPRRAALVATSGLARVVDYPARDLTVTVEAGMRMEELQQLLKSESQRLPVDVAQAHRATLGGAIATNTCGPARYAYGTFRDYVIGVSAIDGQGRLFSAGGRVVKNVAGYDLCKLLIGSLGTLAIITQVTLKLRPQPETRRLVWAPIGDLQTAERVLDGLLTSQARPVALELLNAKAARQLQSELVSPLPADTPVLCLAVEGTEHEADWQIVTLRQELAPFQPLDLLTIADEAAGKLWSALVEYQAASDDPVTFQASLPPSRTVQFLAAATESGVAAQAHAGNGIVIGHLPDRCTAADEAARLIDPLRALARRHGGALVLLNCEQAWKAPLSVFGPDRPESGLMRRVKACLDPHDVLNPGRLWSAQR